MGNRSINVTIVVIINSFGILIIFATFHVLTMVLVASIITIFIIVLVNIGLVHHEKTEDTRGVFMSLVDPMFQIDVLRRGW